MENAGLERLCRIEFENLNSLVGRWSLDLETSAFARGVFSITGPTGAGKTTLLDALCLALFGQTPRLGFITGKSNEIMSFGQASCRASVVFTAGGRRWKAAWSQRRAKNSPLGNLQTPEHRLAELTNSGERPEERIEAALTTEVRRKVAELLRMDYQQFVRTALLPQGAWAAFLEAPANERAALLEKLTGADWYGRISTFVYEENKIKDSGLEHLRARLDELVVMEDDLRRSLDERCRRLAEEMQELRDTGADLDRLIDVWRQREEWHAEAARLSSEEQRHLEKKAAFASAARALVDHRRVEPLVSCRESLALCRAAAAATRQEWSEASKDLAEVQQRLAFVRNAAESKRRAKDESLASLRAAEHDVEEKLNGLGDVKSMENRLEKLTELVAAAEGDELRRVELERLGAKLEGDLASAERDLATAVTFLNEVQNARDGATLDLLRRKLQEGEPCPLCGARHHQLDVLGSLPGSRDTDEIDNALRKARGTHQQRTEAKSGVEAKLGTVHTQLNELEQRQAGRRECLLELLPAGQSPVEALAALHCRIDDGILLEAEARRLADEIRRLLEDDSSPLTLTRDSESAKAQKRVDAVQERVDCLRGVMQERDERLREAENRMALTLVRLSFDESWEKLVLDGEQLAEWQRCEADLEDERRRLQGWRQAVDNRSKSLPAAPAENRSHLEERRGEIDKQVEVATLELGRCKAHQDADDQNRQRRKELLEQKKLAVADVRLWDELNGLIGSARGDSFRRFVQALTFANLLRRANGWLATLGSRYRLIAREDGGLDFGVVDTWQGDVVRSPKSLSGGESFVVSLALALGLGGKRRRSVLFIDEGFGTLDADNLETVLEALSNLQRDGSLVGLISHVEALKDRVECRIEVEPNRDIPGTSHLSGPGVGHPH